MLFMQFPEKCKRKCEVHIQAKGYSARNKLDNEVEISVRDNGIGVPANLKEKIFQPFFTTKTGEGTGLGLSLSYDIITKGHGGELKVKTKEDKEQNSLSFCHLIHEKSKNEKNI